MPINWQLFKLKKLPDSNLPKAEEQRAKQRAIQIDEKKKKAIARKRDNDALPLRGCRWPKADHDTPNHECQGPLEMMHREAKGMGGDRDGTRTSTGDLLQACAWIHQRSKDAVERHGRTWDGSADGPVKFYRRGVLIAEERRIGVLKRGEA